MGQPPWIVCTNTRPVPVFVNPFPPPRPMHILPPPPLGPAPPSGFYYPPPNLAPFMPPAVFPVPGQCVSTLPPAPMPPGPWMLPQAQQSMHCVHITQTPPAPQAPPAQAAQAPPAPPAPPATPEPPAQQAQANAQAAAQASAQGTAQATAHATAHATAQAMPAAKKSAPASDAGKSDKSKSSSIKGIVQDKTVQTLEPKKGPISKDDKEALCDFEERTRRQQFLRLAESQKQSSEAKPADQPQSILKNAYSATPRVNQEVHVKVYNSGLNSKAAANHNAPSQSGKSTKSVAAKPAASVREEAMKRAHQLAQNIANATAPVAAPAMMSGALPPKSQAGASPAPKPAPNGPGGNPSKPPSKAPSNADKSKPGTDKPATPKGPQPGHKPSSQKTSSSSSSSSSSKKSPSHHSQSSAKPPPIIRDDKGLGTLNAAARANADAQVSLPSMIETWRQSIVQPIPA